jgi:hypothetical protein
MFVLYLVVNDLLSNVHRFGPCSKIVSRSTEIIDSSSKLSYKGIAFPRVNTQSNSAFTEIYANTTRLKSVHNLLECARVSGDIEG